MGKSRLVEELARTSTYEHPGGIWFVDLGEARGPEQLVAAVASALGIGAAGREQVGQALDGRGNLLLILDNAERAGKQRRPRTRATLRGVGLGFDLRFVAHEDGRLAARSGLSGIRSPMISAN